MPVAFDEEVRGLVSKGNSKEAVERAKEIHRQVATAATEALLVEAYLARIRALSDRGLAVEARALAELVRKRYPSSRPALGQWKAASAAPRPTLEDLVRPLNDPATPPEKCSAIETTLRKELTDPAALAQCAALRPEHPLKKAAAALSRAFAAATSGTVQDQEIALPEISRRSPLAPWKTLVRAVAAFYRGDDEACERCLGAIDPESGPARLIPPLRALLSGKADPTLKPPASSLVALVGGHEAPVREALRALDAALSSRKRNRIARAIRRAVEECERNDPDLLVSLKQQISIRALVADVPVEQVREAMGGPSLKDARYWRLFACAMEREGDVLEAASLWEEFRRNAIGEGWFAAGGPEEATLYLHVAELLRSVPRQELEETRQRFVEDFQGHGHYYQDQPPSVQAAAPPAETDCYFLHPERLYERTCAVYPDPEVFRQWHAWEEETESEGKAADRVAWAWHEALPRDSRPLLFLMRSAEKRGALKKALGYMELAESVDGLNPEVRRARLRLIVASVLRHARQKNFRLAEKDLAAIEILPQVQEGKRPAFLAALRCLLHRWEGRVEEGARWRSELARRMDGEAGAWIVLRGVASACGTAESGLEAAPAPPELGKLAGAVAQACAVGEDLGVPFEIPQEWEGALSEALAHRDCALAPSDLRTLAEAALRGDRLKLAYEASRVGLARGGATLARFLVLRARSLPPTAFTRRSNCLAAAAELARGQRDTDLVDEAVEELRGGRGFGFAPRDFALKAEALEKVIQREKNAREFPSTSGSAFDEDLTGACDCPACRGQSGRKGPRAGRGRERDLLEEFARSVGGDFFPAGVPPEAIPVFLELLEKYAGPDGSFPDLRVLEKRDPKIVKRLMEILMRSEFGGR